MEKQKYRLEFWKNGKKLVSKVSHDLPREGNMLTRDFYITRAPDRKYTVKKVTELENAEQKTFINNPDKNNQAVLKDKSYVVEVE